ncbi:MAG: TrbC/VirB2 family protein [bacterium]
MKKNKLILFTMAGVLIISALTFGLGYVPSVASAAATIDNPLGTSTNTLEDVLNIIIKAVQAIAGILSVVFVILAGLKFVLAAGDPAKIKKARDMLLYVVIGVAIIFGAQAISTVVQATIHQVGGSK